MQSIVAELRNDAEVASFQGARALEFHWQRAHVVPHRLEKRRDHLLQSKQLEPWKMTTI